MTAIRPWMCWCADTRRCQADVREQNRSLTPSPWRIPRFEHAQRQHGMDAQNRKVMVTTCCRRQQSNETTLPRSCLAPKQLYACNANVRMTDNNGEHMPTLVGEWVTSEFLGIFLGCFMIGNVVDKLYYSAFVKELTNTMRQHDKCLPDLGSNNLQY